MKKLSAILLVLVFTLALSACNNDSNNVKTDKNTPTNSQTLTQQQNDHSASLNDENESTKTETITRDRAIEIALEAASLTKNAVRDLEAELDHERNGVFWEVDFEYGGYDYSYDINANTGQAQRIEKERD